MTPEEAIDIVAKYTPKRPFRNRPRNDRIASLAAMKEDGVPYGREKAIEIIDRMDAAEAAKIRQAQEAVDILRRMVSA